MLSSIVQCASMVATTFLWFLPTAIDMIAGAFSFSFCSFAILIYKVMPKAPLCGCHFPPQKGMPEWWWSRWCQAGGMFAPYYDNFLQKLCKSLRRALCRSDSLQAVAKKPKNIVVCTETTDGRVRSWWLLLYGRRPMGKIAQSECSTCRLSTGSALHLGIGS